MSMRSSLLSVLAALSVAVAAHSSLGAQADRPASRAGPLPRGWRAQTDWSARTDQVAPLSGVKFVAMRNGYHATMGPAAIFWRDADTASGDYRVTTSLAQTRNPDHPEGYGILIGGRDLSGDGQSYTYFLIRPFDGKFSVRRRSGQRTRPVAVIEWTAHEAIKKADSSGRAANELSILVQGGQVSFLVNGTEVHKARSDAVDTKGVVGYRVNHNLDVHLGPLAIHQTGNR
jgi:hypothetical protein